ncbi:hypothetical protein JBE04_05635 [Streptomyces sp. PRKS01-29]|nr:hypothetical protein [Streptomyces sabulosicollis]MBI0293983.1 hypothetical protein [Streptomyces sabulosicollis]
MEEGISDADRTLMVAEDLSAAAEAAAAQGVRHGPHPYVGSSTWTAENIWGADSLFIGAQAKINVVT